MCACVGWTVCRARRVEVGDEVVAMSASWGDRLWDVTSLESFVVGVKLRTGEQKDGECRKQTHMRIKIINKQSITHLDSSNNFAVFAQFSYILFKISPKNYLMHSLVFIHLFTYFCW